MPRKRYKPEEIVNLLRQAEVLHSQGMGGHRLGNGYLHTKRVQKLLPCFRI